MARETIWSNKRQHPEVHLLQLDLENEELALGKLRDAGTAQQQELRQLELTNRTALSDLEMQIKVSEMEVSRLRIDVDNERRLDSIGSGTGDRVRQAETAYRAAVLALEQLRTRLRNERLSTAAAEHSKQLSVSSCSLLLPNQMRYPHHSRLYR